jgi:hypothetical protein
MRMRMRMRMRKNRRRNSLLPKFLDGVGKFCCSDVHMVKRAHLDKIVVLVDLLEAVETFSVVGVDTVLRVPVIITAAPG